MATAQQLAAQDLDVVDILIAQHSLIRDLWWTTG